jgi:Stabilization of polarity axis
MRLIIQNSMFVLQFGSPMLLDLLNLSLGTQILASLPPLMPPPLLLFEASLSNLWSIWECLILCEPILVFASSPTATSQAIWWFRDLLRPVITVYSHLLLVHLPFLLFPPQKIPLANDIRPYFTIHDNDHASLVNKAPPKAGLLVGITNPFIERSCKHWPHVLSLGQRAQYEGSPVCGGQNINMPDLTGHALLPLEFRQ